jgi:hypothetical protein
MKTIHTQWVEKKIAEVDAAIEKALEHYNFMEAQELEIKLSYWEDKLLSTYTKQDMIDLFNEGFPKAV